MSAAQVMPLAPPGWDSHQATLAEEIRFRGRGLHTGRMTGVRVLPRDAGGIVFRRLPRGNEVPVTPALWIKQPLCSTLETPDGVRVRTVEHILAALLMAQLDHALIELDDEEVPILDGGAASWLRIFAKAGRRRLGTPKRFIRMTGIFKRSFGNRSRYRIEPAASPSIHAHIFVPGFGPLDYALELTPESFATAVAPSRSYGHLKWALPAILSGYATGTPILRGVRPSCVAAILGGRVLGGMTVPDEFIRHRILDLVGDFALAGAPIIGKITVHEPSHRRNWRSISAILRKAHLWEWQTAFEDTPIEQGGVTPLNPR